VGDAPGLGLAETADEAGRSSVAPPMSAATTRTTRVTSSGRRDRGGANSSMFTERRAGPPRGPPGSAETGGRATTDGREPSDRGAGVQPCWGAVGGVD